MACVGPADAAALSSQTKWKVTLRPPTPPPKATATPPVGSPGLSSDRDMLALWPSAKHWVFETAKAGVSTLSPPLKLVQLVCCGLTSWHGAVTKYGMGNESAMAKGPRGRDASPGKARHFSPVLVKLETTNGLSAPQPAAALPSAGAR